MPVTLGVVQAGLGVAQTVTGLINSGKAKREAAELERTRPKYSISPLAGDELQLAESDLSNGMSSRAETAYNQLNDRQFSGSLGAILKGGGSVDSVSELYNNSEAGRLRLAEIQDQSRLARINNLVRASRNMEENQDKAFEFNKWRPWADKVQANSQARQGAQKQIWSGLQTTGAAVADYAHGQSDQDAYNNYFNPTGTTAYSKENTNNYSIQRSGMSGPIDTGSSGYSSLDSNFKFNPNP